MPKYVVVKVSMSTLGPSSGSCLTRLWTRDWRALLHSCRLSTHWYPSCRYLVSQYELAPLRLRSAMFSQHPPEGSILSCVSCISQIHLKWWEVISNTGWAWTPRWSSPVLWGLLSPVKVRENVFTGIGLCVCVSVCLSVTTITKKSWTDLHRILCEGS